MKTTFAALPLLLLQLLIAAGSANSNWRFNSDDSADADDDRRRVPTVDAASDPLQNYGAGSGAKLVDWLRSRPFDRAGVLRRAAKFKKQGRLHLHALTLSHILEHNPRDAKVRGRAHAALDKLHNSLDVQRPETQPEWRAEVQRSLRSLRSGKVRDGAREWDVKSLSEEGPGLFVIDDFLSPAECDAFIALHMRTLEAYSGAPVICASQGRFAGVGVASAYIPGFNCLRSPAEHPELVRPLTWSASTLVYRNDYAVADAVAARIEAAIGIRDDAGRAFQLLSYEGNVTYGRHTDCHDSNAMNAEKPRVATVLMYLNDEPSSGLRGGATAFPRLKGKVAVAPRRGSLAVFFSHDRKTGRCDKRSEHESAVVESGQKFVLQRWYDARIEPGQDTRAFQTLPSDGLPPERKPYQPCVVCDQHAGSANCRAYSETPNSMESAAAET